jgi:hypothetical protein
VFHTVVTAILIGMTPDAAITVNQLIEHLPPPFWRDFGFWIAQAIGIAGLYFSVLAWKEAKQAKKAAMAAGRTVKVQTIAIELTEIVQKLDKVQPGIRFSEARDLISETSRRIYRATSPFLKAVEFESAIVAARDAIEAAQSSIGRVRPTGVGKEAEAPDAVYYGIEADCAVISNAVSDLLGLFEKHSFTFGDENA